MTQRSFNVHRTGVLTFELMDDSAPQILSQAMQKRSFNVHRTRALTCVRPKIPNRAVPHHQ
jgi:hypothetical protein